LAEFPEFVLLLAEPSPLAHRKGRLVARVLMAISVNPVPERPLMDTEFFGDLGDRTRRLDHRSYSLFLELRRELSTTL
jgi:hypothetical protein